MVQRGLAWLRMAQNGMRVCFGIVEFFFSLSLFPPVPLTLHFNFSKFRVYVCVYVPHDSYWHFASHQSHTRDCGLTLLLGFILTFTLVTCDCNRLPITVPLFSHVSSSLSLFLWLGHEEKTLRPPL